ncbi:GntR family transcriptional regulator [Arthrobacter sp. zg-Y1171]|uniref:GntR family transcriptional regulator n=1 Tax=Arthrobacter sp. zg-Y1171 TaxID=2964610 RepID=UPI0021062B60|nr:GntR family transcriptional regulator [Arthrobacter sp. zg-Y1171]MCQ1996878.1 GntR family transcriptional regulator [Arthrobacter sp. zg-Y1171]UWX82466.1 GntR family transcriptional regulator [Arthrobacter sp. zg-Y1171]
MTIQKTAAPLREQIVEAIRREIINGSFRPGMRLKEKDLVEKFGVSRTVIREALRQMESERLVRIEPNVGPIVERLTVEVAAELYEVREALECAIMRLAARRRDSTDIEDMTILMLELRASLQADVEDITAIKDRFYALLVSISRNHTIGEMLQNVQTRISQLRRLTLSSPGRGERMLQEIQAMVDAVVAGDEDRALECARTHVHIARDIALAHLRSETHDSLSGTEYPEPEGARL